MSITIRVVMENFSHRFEIIYNKFAKKAVSENRAASKLAFARFLGISQGRMQNWERGKIPQPDDLKLMHDKLGFSYCWLITGEGEPYGEGEPQGRRVSPDQMTPDEKDRRIAELEEELREERRLNRRLMERLLDEEKS